MKKKATITILLTVLMSTIGTKTYAYDIEVANAQGVNIRYNYINNGTELEVTTGSYKGDMVIPDEVTFMGRTRKVTSIGASAFSNCTGLTSVTIPNSVTSIRNFAFAWCTGLTSVTIPNSVTYIGQSAFSGCSRLPSITIPNSVTSLGSGAFQNCSGLTSVTIPNSVTSIGSNAFSGCSGLTSVKIDDSSTTIGDYAFQKCSSLTSVSMGNSVKSIGGYAFDGCSGLPSVTIPNSVTSIGKYAFYGCKGMTSITIPSSVKSIGECAFDGIDLQYVKSYIVNPFAINGKSTNKRVFSKNTFNNATLSVPEGSLNLYKYTEGWNDFLFYEEVPTVEIIDGVRYRLYHYDKTATVEYNASYSGNIDIPSSINAYGASYSVTSIGANAFSGCSGLTSVTIGENVSNIQSKSFANCSLLTNVYCLAKVVPNTASDAFDNSPINEKTTLYVHTLSLDNYEKTEPWKNFNSIITLEPKCAKPTITYYNKKINFSCETEDVEFHYSVSVINFCSGVSSEVPYSPTINISVYASKYGFPNSEIATMRLAAPSDLTGDLNGDGKVNEADHEILSKIILEK